jgi:hypothetical protein
MLVRIFLSYARSDDEPFVRRLYDGLTAAGFEVWFDCVSMPARQLTFSKEIEDAIAARHRLVLVVGPAAVSSDYVTHEWRFAFHQAVKCVNAILRLGDYDLVPEDLRGPHVEDFRDDSAFAAHLASLARQLADSLPPLGKLVAVPSLPDHYLEQGDRIRALRDMVLADLRKPVVVSGTSGRVGLHGMGGIGKSLLANALARRPEIRREFPDGVFWVTLGQQPTITGLQRNIARALGDDGDFTTSDQGRERLRELLHDRAALLILDDAWQPEHAEAFNVIGPRCRLLLTTRDARLVTAFAAKENHYQVQLPTPTEAREMLAKAAAATELPIEAASIIEECDRLPLALALCGGMVYHGTSWTDLLEALRDHDLRFLSDAHPGEEQHADVWKAIDVSVRVLPEDERRRFAELAVFALDTGAPEAAVETMWEHTAGLTPRYTRKLLHDFAARSLVQLDAGRMTLHDLVHDFATRMSEPLDRTLLDAYRKKCPEGWPSGPNDGYFLEKLSSHMARGELWVELSKLASDGIFPRRQRQVAGVLAMGETLRLGLASALLCRNSTTAESIADQWRRQFGEEFVRQRSLFGHVSYIELVETLEVARLLDLPLLPARVVLLLAWNALHHGHRDLCTKSIKYFLNWHDAYLAFEEAHLFSAFFRLAWAKGIPGVAEAWRRAYPVCFAGTSVLRAMRHYLPEIPPELLRIYLDIQSQIPSILPNLSRNPSDEDLAQALRIALDAELSSTRDADPMVRSLLDIDLEASAEVAWPAYAAKIQELLTGYQNPELPSSMAVAFHRALSGEPLPRGTAECLDLIGGHGFLAKTHMSQALELAVTATRLTPSRDISAAIVRRVASSLPSMPAGERTFSLGGRTLPYRREFLDQWSRDARILLLLFSCASAVGVDSQTWVQVIAKSRSLKYNNCLEGTLAVLSVFSIRSEMPDNLIRILLDCSRDAFSPTSATAFGVALAFRSDAFDVTPWLSYLLSRDGMLGRVAKQYFAAEREDVAEMIRQHVAASPGPEQMNTPAIIAGLLAGFANRLLPGIVALPVSTERDLLLYTVCLTSEEGQSLRILPSIRDRETRLGAARLLAPCRNLLELKTHDYAYLESAALPRVDPVLSTSADGTACQFAVRRAISELFSQDRIPAF